MPCYSQDNVPEGYIAKFPDGPAYESEEDCLDACAEGACCETDGACNIKPQCECDTDNGAVFAGVGETCEACAYSYCGCEEFNFLGSSVTINIKNLAFSTDPRYQPHAIYSGMNQDCSDEDILEQADLGPFTLPFFGWGNLCNWNPPPGHGCWSPQFRPTTYDPGLGFFRYSPEQNNGLRYICRSVGNAYNNCLEITIQSPLFGRLPCQRDHDNGTPSGSFSVPIDNYFVYSYPIFFANCEPQAELFCRLLAGETVTIDTYPPRSGYHVTRYRNSLSNPVTDDYSIPRLERDITCTIEITMNPLP